MELGFVPSMRIPMRMASVPVVGYLSFLASNSPIANDLIAFLDHLLHSPTTNSQSPPKTKTLQKKTQQNFNKTHLGTFSAEENLSGFLQNQKNNNLGPSKNGENFQRPVLCSSVRVGTYAVGRLDNTEAAMGRCFDST
jgi:hypothetical protein